MPARRQLRAPVPSARRERCAPVPSAGRGPDGPQRPLRVGLDLVHLVADAGGTATYALELVRALHAVEPGTRVTAWVGRGAPTDLEGLDLGGEVTWIRLPVRSTGSPVHVAVELLGLGLDARRRGLDVVHGAAYAAPLLAPGVATVVTVPDLTWRHHPEAVTPLARVMFELLGTLCPRACDRVIAISEAVRDDLVATLGLDRAKIDVTPLGTADRPRAAPTPEAALRAALGLGADERVVLCVGQVAPHKNLVTLVEAVARLPERPALVLAGRDAGHADVVAARATELGVRLVLPGFVSDADVEGLFALASMFVLPSVSEGFGLPVLEAMARGVPVACADRAALPEVAGGAALLFDPHDRHMIASACARLLGDAVLRADLVARGRARAAACTWEACARATLACYRRAIADRAR